MRYLVLVPEFNFGLGSSLLPKDFEICWTVGRFSILHQLIIWKNELGGLWF